MAELDAEAFAALKELLKDAESCARMTVWEEGFLDDLRSRVLLYKANIRLSDSQREVIRRIEGKVYAAG